MPPLPEVAKRPKAVRMAKLIPNPAQVKLICELYHRQPRASDDLSYTPEFEMMFRKFREEFPSTNVTRYSLNRAVIALRKKKILPTKPELPKWGRGRKSNHI